MTNLGQARLGQVQPNIYRPEVKGQPVTHPDPSLEATLKLLEVLSLAKTSIRWLGIFKLFMFTIKTDSIRFYDVLWIIYTQYSLVPCLYQIIVSLGKALETTPAKHS